MKRQLGPRLPSFTPDESAMLKGSSDFYGMNTYTSDYIKERRTEPEREDYLGNVEVTKIGADGRALGPQGESFWLQDGSIPLPSSPLRNISRYYFSFTILRFYFMILLSLSSRCI
jgi:hypothetical protein